MKGDSPGPDPMRTLPTFRSVLSLHLDPIRFRGLVLGGLPEGGWCRPSSDVHKKYNNGNIQKIGGGS